MTWRQQEVLSLEVTTNATRENSSNASDSVQASARLPLLLLLAWLPYMPRTRSAYTPRPYLNMQKGARTNHAVPFPVWVCVCAWVCVCLCLCLWGRVCVHSVRRLAEFSTSAAAAGPRQAASSPVRIMPPWTWAIARHIREKAVHMVKSSGCSGSNSSWKAIKRWRRAPDERISIKMRHTSASWCARTIAYTYMYICISVQFYI